MDTSKGLNTFSEGFKEGAVAGGLVGIVIAAILRRKLWVGGLVGLIAGGYISSEINKTKKESLEIKEALIQN